MPSDDFQDGLIDCVMGTASSEERARVETDPVLSAELAQLEKSLEAVAVGFSAPGHLWRRLADALAGAKRFEHLVPQLAELFDLDEATARQLTEHLDDATAWQEGPGDGVWLIPVNAGPKWSGFITTLLKLDPGAQFPLHRHGADERVLLLEGGYRDDQSGVEFWRGELDERAVGTSHSFTSLPGMGCLCASVTKLPEDE
jgi:hypothetical protein